MIGNFKNGLAFLNTFLVNFEIFSQRSLFDDFLEHIKKPATAVYRRQKKFCQAYLELTKQTNCICACKLAYKTSLKLLSEKRFLFDNQDGAAG
jgi:hypothetical protein